jgi:hypothetical protein
VTTWLPSVGGITFQLTTRPSLRQVSLAECTPGSQISVDSPVVRRTAAFTCEAHIDDASGIRGHLQLRASSGATLCSAAPSSITRALTPAKGGVGLIGTLVSEVAPRILRLAYRGPRPWP